MAKKMRLRERYRCPNNNLFILALISWIVFLVIEVSIRMYTLYATVPLVDIPSHFFAGIAIAMGVYWILSLTLVKRKKITTWIFTFVIAIFWEILETLEDLVVYNPDYLKDIFFWDGIGDIIVTLIGGIFATFLLYILRKKTILLNDSKIDLR